jgi:hypothetical protein
MQEVKRRDQTPSPPLKGLHHELEANSFSRPDARVHFDFLKRLVSSPDIATPDELAQRGPLVNQALNAVTTSIAKLSAERRIRAKEVFAEAVKQFETEVLPGLTSDILLPPDSGPYAQRLHEVLKNAIRDDLVRPFLRGRGAAVFTLLEYIDRQMELKRGYPGIEGPCFVNGLECRGYSIDPKVARAFKAVTLKKRVGQLSERLLSSSPEQRQLSFALLSLPAIADSFSSESIADALSPLGPSGTSEAVGYTAIRRQSSDFAADLLSGLRGALSSKDLRTANDFIRSQDFLFAARLNAGRFERILQHVEAFCLAVKNPYGETPESIGKECIHSLCEPFKRFRDDFITWRFEFLKGAEEAISKFGWETNDYWLSTLFRGGVHSS